MPRDRRDSRHQFPSADTGRASGLGAGALSPASRPVDGSRNGGEPYGPGHEPARTSRPREAQGGDSHGRLRLVVGLFACGYLVLSCAWALGTPAPSGTDEAAHYVKALATGQGELVGPHVLFPFRDPHFPDVMYYWDQTTMTFRVPARQAPWSTFQCLAGDPTVPATCVSGPPCARWAACSGPNQPRTGDLALVTYVGDYVPTMYVVPGLLARLGDSDVNGLRLARVGAILVALLLVTLAALLLADRRAIALSLVGLFVSVTPTAVYLNSVLNPNGGEIAASICFGAALIRLWRDGGDSPRWVWLAAGGSGALLGFSRVYGPLWMGAATAATVLLLGLRPSLAALRRAGWPALLAVGLAAAGILADLAWWRIVGVPRSRESLLTFPRFLWLYVNTLPQIFEQEIGLFGWMDISPGAIPYLIWSVMVMAVVLLALLVANARQRAVLLLLIAGDLVVTVVLGAVMRVAWDFPGPGVVGRYFLPWSVVVTLLAGEILHRNAARLGSLLPRSLLLQVAIGAALCQGICLYMADRRFAVGTNGPLLFLRASQWSPHFGWLPWLALTGLGCVLVVAAGLQATYTRPLDTVAATAGRTLARVRAEPVGSAR